METAVIYDPIYLEHETGSHPENGERLVSVIEAIDQSGLKERLRWMQPQAATEDDLATVHTRGLIEQVRRMSELGGAAFDSDTIVSPGSYEAALFAAGGTYLAVDAVLNRDVKNAFALVRPPGHHAVPDRSMGFCLFNNISIATRLAQARHHLERVLIVDFDVHHGNGTQEIFWREKEVLYFSLHEYPFYPGTGAVEQIGEGEGKGYTVNVPLPVQTGDKGHLRVFDEILLPVAHRYQPQLILVSAGYDGHWMDPLGGFSMTVTGYARLIERLMALADELCGGKLVFTLEGGYSLKALADSMVVTLQVVMGLPYRDALGAKTPEVNEPAIDGLLERVKAVHRLG
jgi:acetoin utilization deacetylase AcuC-like enzyme